MNGVLPKAWAKQTSYENVATTCPNCRRACILNRRSDLETCTPVAGKEVACTECGLSFWLMGDTVNAGYESLLFDCADLLRTKRYMLAVVGACQSYEMFFGLYLLVELVYVPWGMECQTEPWPSIESLNDMSKALRTEVERLPFDGMRTRFLRHAISHAPPQNLRHARGVISSLRRSKHWHRPTPGEIAAAPVGKGLKRLLLGVASTDVNKLRNKVVHKEGYRPSRDEAETAVDEARSLLFPLGTELDLREDVNWYTGRPAEQEAERR